MSGDRRAKGAVVVVHLRDSSPENGCGPICRSGEDFCAGAIFRLIYRAQHLIFCIAGWP
jgi:hypothetical protein